MNRSLGESLNCREQVGSAVLAVSIYREQQILLQTIVSPQNILTIWWRGGSIWFNNDYFMLGKITRPER